MKAREIWRQARSVSQLTHPVASLIVWSFNLTTQGLAFDGVTDEQKLSLGFEVQRSGNVR
ncbi:hypothetical protein PS880_05024 [Pseudomonas fluorescens]|uniref:Uncharacterized protein n=1 Tax=Pseudomonas fluorescens TaxID=294 RepID=A0A5E7PAR2_PSEFL|nr:hypothetical protein PS880_05024 [Pseudomonas fluorescens]